MDRPGTGSWSGLMTTTASSPVLKGCYQPRASLQYAAPPPTKPSPGRWTALEFPRWRPHLPLIILSRRQSNRRRKSSGAPAPRYGVTSMTTIVSVRRGDQVALAGDGQVSLGNTVMKGNASKVRRLYRGQVLAGFAGGTADAFTLFERFEAQLEKYQGNLVKAAVELAKEWRTDRTLRRLEALLAVADKDASLIITGNGDVVEPERGIIAIGSGGNFALSAARALLENTELSAREITEKSLEIAGDICVFTNHHVTLETL